MASRRTLNFSPDVFSRSYKAWTLLVPAISRTDICGLRMNVFPTEERWQCADYFNLNPDLPVYAFRVLGLGFN